MLYVRQLKLGPMDNFVYLVGAEGAPEVAVIDPAWDVPAVMRAAAEDGKRIACAVVSHCHGDHTNGLEDLLHHLDVPVYAQKRELEFSADLRSVGDAMKGVDPGEAVQVGPLKATLLHTPGHTPGSHCVLAGDALVSGDTIFVNACGRCDLPGGNPEEMYRSISQVLARLPPETRLLPGHDYGDVPASTLARERERNPYFQHHDLASFIALRMRPRR
ncbi:MAG TPA: MBL fold metallo-hydrolase [Myxococcales bacterium]|jgi:glyoxylase-like metal-dependent hydrolase (beta-lactamase superfamily II)|nr:MBL fold metallo-hydrolase [Myxococcales bacterium]